MPGHSDLFAEFEPVLLRIAAKPMYLFLDRILQGRIRVEYVRTEAKRAIMMAGIACELLGAFQ